MPISFTNLYYAQRDLERGRVPAEPPTPRDHYPIDPTPEELGRFWAEILDGFTPEVRLRVLHAVAEDHCLNVFGCARSLVEGEDCYCERDE